MNCLCCGNELKNEQDMIIGWHKRCIKAFFGTTKIPEIVLDENIINELAYKSVNKGLTVPGVQKKLSLHLDKTKGSARFTIVDYPTGFILKPQSTNYEQLPEAEHLVMSMARATGIAVVPFALICFNGEYAYITRRIDRLNDNKYAMEDFCQLAGKITSDKYKGSYEMCGKILKRYSQRIGFDISELFLRLVFCSVVGNSDMHLKNFSLIEIEPKNREYVLSPAYDLLPVNVILPADKEFMALTLNGKKRNIRKNDFLKLAENIGLNAKVANDVIKKVIEKQSIYEHMVKESFMSDEYKKRMLELMDERIKLLE